MPIPGGPCRGCGERTVYCHTTCEKYLTYHDACVKQGVERVRNAVSYKALPPNSMLKTRVWHQKHYLTGQKR